MANTLDKHEHYKNYNSWIRDNTFKFRNLTNQRLVSEFTNSVQRLIYKFNHREINLDFSEVKEVFAFPAVPIVGVIDFYKERGISFNYIQPNSYLKHINISDPIRSSKEHIDKYYNKIDRIWYFTNTEEICNLVDAVILCLRRTIICEPGILDACAWAINEVMDNVINHAEINKGFLMAQRHDKNINICIFDWGRGIYNTLKKSEHRPGNAIDAISLSIKEGVTRDKKVGLGNGLWGLYNITSLNDGHLSIRTGNGGMYFKKQGQDVRTQKDIIMLNRNYQTTSVDFHLKLDKEISIMDAIKSDTLVDLAIENMENDKGEIVYKVSDIGTGTGTRESAHQIKNEILNIYKRNQQPILIDFSDVSIISSSFADELVGKLISEIGFYQFQSIFKLVHMNTTIQAILEQTFQQRLGKDSSGKG